jgi:hypothetical protein
MPLAVDIYGADQFGASLRDLGVDAYTSAYRVSGTVRTRFGRVADIVNLLSSSHLVIERATVHDFDAPTADVAAEQALVSLDELLLLVAENADGTAQSEMRIAKRPIRAEIGVPPFRLTGTVHLAPGSRPTDGLLNLSERFMPMTAVTIACPAHPELDRTVAAVAVRRDRAHLMLVTDDERPDELLADVLDERTAEAWLRPHPEELR